MYPRPESRIRLVVPEGQERLPITLRANADFTYLLRKDGDLFIRPFAERLTRSARQDQHTARAMLHEEYETFFEGLIDALHVGLKPRGSVEIHVFNSDSLNRAVDSIVGNQRVISMDPLYAGEEIIDFPMSRIYNIGGSRRMREETRPGSHLTFSQQARAIAQEVGETPVAVVDDNIVTGGTVLTAVHHLQKAGVTISRIVTGVQVGHSPRLESLGIPVVPAVQYERTVEGNIFNHVELGEPRDFLIGASGLVTQFPNGDFGRVPFILPFLRPQDKVGIPHDTIVDKNTPSAGEIQFSLDVLRLNYLFYAGAAAKLGREVLLEDVDPDFSRYMIGVHNMRPDMPMRDVITWAATNIEEKWQVVHAIGRQQVSGSH